MQATDKIPTILVVPGDGTTETMYYSDAPVRLVVAEPDLIAEDPDERILEPIVFDLPDDDLPEWIQAKLPTKHS